MSIAQTELDPTTWPAGWRDDWELRELDFPPRAWHRCGLCFFLEYEPVDEQGSWEWVVYDDDLSQSRLHELQAEVGEEEFQRLCALLGRQAKTRWKEMGHSDFRLVR